MADKKFIDLGEDYGELSSPTGEGKNHIYYPSISLEEVPEGMKVGDEGEATIKFKVCSRSEREDEDEGVKKSASLEVRQIAFGGKPKKSPDKADDNQKAIKRGLDEESEEE